MEILTETACPIWLYLVNAGWWDVSILLNTTSPGATTPSFSTKVDFTTGDGPFWVSIGDLNGDGKPDLAVACMNSNCVSVLLNSFTPLPVELSSFSAIVEKNIVKLFWETKTEVNNYGFKVLRQYQDEDWVVLGFVEGYGNSNSPKVYSFVDDNVNSGRYSYRLKQIDNDGTFEYSGIVEIYVGAPLEFELSQNYPNPFNPVTTIKYSVPVKSQVDISIYNTIGEKVKQLVNEEKEAGRHLSMFNAIILPSGVYFCRIQAGSFVETKKMVLMK